MKSHLRNRITGMIVAGWALCAASGCVGGRGSAEGEIRAMLEVQDAAWNRGDIEGFMAHYWRSEDLSFSSGGQTTRGWAATMERYQRRYPTTERMGKLTFSDLRITPLGRSSAMALGRWHLERGDDDVGGNFTLVLRRIGGRWVIVHDHTSVSVPPEGE